jgi:hypothetical protein
VAHFVKKESTQSSLPWLAFEESQTWSTLWRPVFILQSPPPRQLPPREIRSWEKQDGDPRYVSQRTRHHHEQSGQSTDGRASPCSFRQNHVNLNITLREGGNRVSLCCHSIAQGDETKVGSLFFVAFHPTRIQNANSSWNFNASHIVIVSNSHCLRAAGQVHIVEMPGFPIPLVQFGTRRTPSDPPCHNYSMGLPAPSLILATPQASVETKSRDHHANGTWHVKLSDALGRCIAAFIYLFIFFRLSMRTSFRVHQSNG